MHVHFREWAVHTSWETFAELLNAIKFDSGLNIFDFFFHFVFAFFRGGRGKSNKEVSYSTVQTYPVHCECSVHKNGVVRLKKCYTLSSLGLAQYVVQKKKRISSIWLGLRPSAQVAANGSHVP